MEKSADVHSRKHPEKGAVKCQGYASGCDQVIIRVVFMVMVG